MVDELKVTSLDIEKAEEIKNAANKLFAAKKYNDAILKYTEAISYNPNVPAYYTNRAFAYIKTEMYGAAIKDAEEALKLDPSFIKGYYRRAIGNMGMGRLKESIRDLRNVVKYAPRDADAKQKLSECEQEYRRIEFEKAIQCEDSKSALEQLGNINEMTVDNYSGPNLNEPITKEFCIELLEHLKQQGKLHLKYALQILRSIKEIFEKEATIVDIPIAENAKITVCGDVHGQFYDLLKIFELNGYPSMENMYLFNGDFVDRGNWSVECMLVLFAFKCLYPTGVWLTRGNHETNSMNAVYGFEKECKVKYTPLTFKLCSEIFNAMPLGFLIQEKILVLHGGLFSRDDVTLDEIRKINRFRQPPNEGLMCEMLWSDPQTEMGRSMSNRGIGVQFGPDVTEKFCKLNNLKCIIRSHQVREEGYTIEHNGQCITVFSAPNYCDSVGNKGAFINITRDLEMKYNQFAASPHPNLRPMMYASSLNGMM